MQLQQTAPGWQAPASDGGMFEGIHDAGIATFTESSIEKEGREAIQNALDPVVDDKKPVRVEIHISPLRASDIPGAPALAATFTKCADTLRKMEQMNGEPEDAQTLQFYQRAKTLIDLDAKLQLVRISDYNTTGLVGAADGKIGSAWHKLVKARGLNNKSGSAGGSFGIGKMASFACSRLRTVFYGTRVGGEDSYIGVARLQSYAERWDGDRPVLTAGTSYYSAGPDMLAIPGPCPLRDTPRTEDGTDVYILGTIGKDDEIFESFRRAVLFHFFITIYEGKLVVELSDGKTTVTIDKDALGREINALVEQAPGDDDVRDLWEYYDILRHEDVDDPENYLEIPLLKQEFGADYGFGNGECRLLLKKGENLNRRILITRKTGMRLFEAKNFPGGLSFTGILRIEGEAMNALYRKMEVPSHDKWVPDQCKDGEHDYAAAYRDLRRYLGRMVEENCASDADAAVTAYGMEEFFLTDETSVEEKKTTQPGGGQPAKKKPRITAKQQNPTTKKQSAPGDAPRVAKKPDDPPKKGPGGPRQPRPHDWRQRSVLMHLVALNPTKSLYRLTFRAPATRTDVKVELLGSPERRMTKEACGLRVARAACAGHAVTVEGNEMHLGAVQKGEDIAIDFTLALPGLFMMEANYYEAK